MAYTTVIILILLARTFDPKPKSAQDCTLKRSNCWIVGETAQTKISEKTLKTIKVPQKLLEFRYFMVPFVILQLFSIRRTSRLSIIYNLLVNAFTFYIFKTKGNFFMTLLDKSDFYLRNSMERYE